MKKPDEEGIGKKKGQKTRMPLWGNKIIVYLRTAGSLLSGPDKWRKRGPRFKEGEMRKKELRRRDGLTEKQREVINSSRDRGIGSGYRGIEPPSSEGKSGYGAG